MINVFIFLINRTKIYVFFFNINSFLSFSCFSNVEAYRITHLRNYCSLYTPNIEVNIFIVEANKTITFFNAKPLNNAFELILLIIFFAIYQFSISPVAEKLNFTGRLYKSNMLSLSLFRIKGSEKVKKHSNSFK